MEDNKEKNQIILVGSHTHTLDAKKRIIFPSLWRNIAVNQNQIYAFAHPEQPCLYLYLKDEILRRIFQLRSKTLDINDENSIRGITSGADLLMWDTQGRIRIGDHLLRHIEAKSQIVLVGVLSRIEIWSAERFDLALPKSSEHGEKVFFSNY